LDSWTRYWRTWVWAEFLGSYLRTATPGSFLPKGSDELQTLLNVFLMEKAVYELGYELNNRPSWVRIPLQGILETLAGETQVTTA
jgi:maltose alpha-D-glucosyltransferase / alpha-amylase